jgi:DNA-binding NarL/FixJ family response regulator
LSSAAVFPWRDASGADQYFAQAGSRPLARQSLSGLQRKGWALATHLRKRFSTLTLYIIDDRIAVADAAYLLAKEPRRVRSLDCCLTVPEFNVLDLMLTGLPVRHIAIVTHMSEKQVSTHKCNALKKLNANNLLQLLL